MSKRTLWKGSSEEFAKMKGWTKVDGWKIDISSAEEDWDFMLVADINDFATKEEFWQHAEIEAVYDCVDTLIECQYEDHFDNQDNLCDEPVQEEKNEFKNF